MAFKHNNSFFIFSESFSASSSRMLEGGLSMNCMSHKFSFSSVNIIDAVSLFFVVKNLEIILTSIPRGLPRFLSRKV